MQYFSFEMIYLKWDLVILCDGWKKIPSVEALAVTEIPSKEKNAAY